MGLKHFSITPHAPYSASVELLNKISDHAWQNNSILSIHNQENEDENLLFQNKSGKILERLHYFGINTDNWKATGKTSLQSVIVHLPRNLPLLLVHNTFSSKEDIEFANEYNQRVYWCFCANANLYIEKKLPRFELFTDNIRQLTIGTDSYASNHSLSVTDEINTIRKNNAAIKLEALLKWATINGARFLGMNERLGSFEKGKIPGGVLLEEKGGKLISKRIF
jgi:cytosine/adenosine deaminase-related metal-dependent hydrolase